MPNKISRAPEYAFFRGFKTFARVLDMSGDQYVRLVDVSQMDVGSASINFSGTCCTQVFEVFVVVGAHDHGHVGRVLFDPCQHLQR